MIALRLGMHRTTYDALRREEQKTLGKPNCRRRTGKDIESPEF
jgi:hypothetical protein